MAGIQFVPQTGTKEDDQDTRKSIRRHVMLGKNQGRAQVPKQPMPDGFAVFRMDNWAHNTLPTHSLVPRRVGSDLSFLEFADTVELPLINETIRFCSSTDEKLFILEPCISFDLCKTGAACVESLSHDALHLNIMVFGAQMYMDQIFWQTTLTRRDGPSKATMQHYGKALHLLRERLVGVDTQPFEVSDITVMSIVSLVMHALFTGETESGRNHVIGLSRLVRMRENGVHSFRDQTKHMIEILRCDISLSLATGQAPLFFQNPTHEPQFPYPELPAPPETLEHLPPITNSELAKIWDVLGRFCAMINEATVDQRKLSDQILLEIVASVMYRLLNMSITRSSGERVLHLATICFCVSTLLTWPQLRMPLGWLQLKFKRSIANLMRSNSGLQDPSLLLWYLMIYSITFSPLTEEESEEVESWLMEVIDVTGVTAWDGVKRITSKFLWIDIVCDRPAEELINKFSVDGLLQSTVPRCRVD